MEIDIVLWERMGMSLYTTMGLGWEREYGHGKGRKWDRKKSFPHIFDAQKTEANVEAKVA